MKLNYYLAINASRISLHFAFQKDGKVTAMTIFLAGLFLSLHDRRQHMAIIYVYDSKRNINKNNLAFTFYPDQRNQYEW